MMKKLLSIFILTTLISCVSGVKKTGDKKTINDCLIGDDWCLPNCESPNMVWGFSYDGTFKFSTTLFGGNSASGTWKEIDDQKIEIKYTQNTTNKNVPNQIINMLNCTTLKVGSSLYKRK